MSQAPATPPATTRSAIVSLAVLKVNWDVARRDYIETFVPMVAECIRQSTDDLVSVIELQQQLERTFGLRFPQHTLRLLLQRVCKRGYIRRDGDVYRRDDDKLATLRYREEQQRVLRTHEALIGRLASFANAEYRIPWLPAEAEAALHSYLAEHELVTVAQGKHDNLLPHVARADRRSDVVVAAFVRYLQETQSPDLDYLDTIVKGNMLANAIFLADPSQATRKFRNTEMYFDTSFLIFALGYAGDPRRAPCLELLHLLHETGARLRCFRHTLDEVRGVLEACANELLRGHGRAVTGPGLDTIQYFVGQGWTPSDVEEKILSLEDDLRALGIAVVDKPGYLASHTVDEAKLQQMLADQVGYHNPNGLAVSRDVDSICAVLRLQAGERQGILEECPAIFVTTNVTLVRVAQDFFYADEPKHVAFPCLTDAQLTYRL